MGASQTLLLRGVLRLSDKTFTGNSLLRKSIELGVVSASLHHFYLKSDMITGPVIVGIYPTIPIKEISIVIGNDLAERGSCGGSYCK